MKLADGRLRGLDSLTADERARRRCEVAADLICAGQYEEAREALGELWRGVGERSNVEGLAEATAAEVLLQCGSLSGWLGSSKRVGGAQDAAKDLIGEAQRLFESHGLQGRVAEAEYELGMCYWRAGAFDAARLVLQDAIRRLGTDDYEQKGRILIRSTLPEVSEGRYRDALIILDAAEHVFDHTPDAIKGKFHGQRAMVLRRLWAAERRADYFDRAIIEFTAAIVHFERAGHERYCGNAENNLAMLLHLMGGHAEAHQHLDRAQRIFTRLNDAGNMAQVRETRARIFLAEKRYEKAADAIKGAVGALEKAGESALLADALTVQATVEAGQGRHYLSLPTFRRAVKVAEDAGALESAGLAAVALLEEHGAARLSETEVYETYCRADDLLSETQDAEAVARLRKCARSVARRLAVVEMGPDFSLTEAVREFEAEFIRRALEDARGSVSRAARRLGIEHQKLIYLMKTRHTELMSARTPVIKRRRSIIKKK
jgi:tetratricopeptide (TPR) repeat protein